MTGSDMYCCWFICWLMWNEIVMRFTCYLWLVYLFSATNILVFQIYSPRTLQCLLSFVLFCFVFVVAYSQSSSSALVAFVPYIAKTFPSSFISVWLQYTPSCSDENFGLASFCVQPDLWISAFAYSSVLSSYTPLLHLLSFLLFQVI